MKNKLKQKIISLLGIGAIIANLFAGVLIAHAADFNVLKAYGVDTVAGYSTILSSSKTYPNQKLTFHVLKPDNSVVTVDGKTDYSGIAKVDLYDYHTRKSGTYSVWVTSEGVASNDNQSSFTVYPDDVSPDTSSVDAEKNLVKADNTEIAYLVVRLEDKYGNSIRGHVVNLISSRSADEVEKQNGGLTDDNGVSIFKVKSGLKGTSSFSAIDTTAGVLVNEKAQVSFISSIASDIGGGFINVAAAEDVGSINHFELSDFPTSIGVNQNISFRVTAKDKNNVTVENYSGTIHFSIEGDNGDNVTLPEDYSFKAEDLGTHLFSLGLKFTTQGSYKVVATDIGNQLISGTQDVKAGSADTAKTSGSTSGATKSTTKPKISTPTDGSYGQNAQVISGSATAGSTIKIMDNGQEIGTVQATADGTFTYQASNLADGNHKLTVNVLDSNKTVQGTSNTVTIKIDTTPPKLDQIELIPNSGIKPDSVVNVKVYSESELQQAAVIFNNDIIQLSPGLDANSSYVGSFKAPKEPGVYKLDVFLSDQLGNDITYKEKATITIDSNSGEAKTNSDQIESKTQEQTQVQTEEQKQPEQLEQTQQQTANLPPSQVFGLTAYGSNGRVNLTWQAATDDSKVNNYRIYYGLDPYKLEDKVDTKDASLSWYIPNLVNGKQYYFSVVAVDDVGMESIQRSEVVGGVPFTLEVNNQVSQPPSQIANVGGDNGLHSAALELNKVKKTSGTGPEVMIYIVGTAAITYVTKKLKSKKK